MAHSREESFSLILPRSDDTRKCMDNTRCISRVGSSSSRRRLALRRGHRQPAAGTHRRSRGEEPLCEVSGTAEPGESSEGRRLEMQKHRQVSEGTHMGHPEKDPLTPSED